MNTSEYKQPKNNDPQNNDPQDKFHGRIIGLTSKIRGAVIYTRVSTADQDKFGTSPETQRDACRAKALAMGLPIVAEYHDGGVSGGFLLSRKEFQAALADIQAGRAGTLICPNISRFSRDVEHQQAVKKAVRAAGGQLMFCDMEFADTPEGDLNFAIQGGFAEYEKAVIRKRTMSGRRSRAEDGQQPSRAKSPFGYRIVTKADVLRGDYPADQLGRYQVIEDQARIVRELFARYASGADSLNQLARWLNAAGVKPSGKAVYWWVSGLRYLLQNTVYKGEAHFGQRMHRMEESRLTQINPKTGQPYKQSIVRRPADAEYTIDFPCPPVVEAGVWDRANARLSQNQSVFSGNPDRVRMLSGRVFCPSCGGRMATCGGSVSTYVSVRGETIRYPKEKRYTCMDSGKMAAITGQRPCPATFMARQTEEAALSAILSAAQGDASLKDAVREWEAAKRRQNKPEAGLGRAALRQEKAAVEDALSALTADDFLAVQAQMAGMKAGASPDAYAAVFAELAGRRKVLEDRRRVLAQALKPLNQAEASVLPKKAIPGKASGHDKVSAGGKASEHDKASGHDKVSAGGKASEDNAEGFKARALEIAHRVLTSPDVSGAKKRQIAGALIEKVVCRKDGADVWFLPGVIGLEDIELQDIKLEDIRLENIRLENIRAASIGATQRKDFQASTFEADILVQQSNVLAHQADISFQADTLQSISMIFARTRI